MARTPPNIRECCLTCVFSPRIRKTFPKVAFCFLQSNEPRDAYSTCEKYEYDKNYENKSYFD